MIQNTIALSGSDIKDIVLALFGMVNAALVIAIPLWLKMRLDRQSAMVKDTKAKVEEGNQDTKSKLEGIHTLVNDQLTREKSARLTLLKAQLAILRKFFGESTVPKEQGVITDLDVQIEALSGEITKRNEAAATLTKAQGAAS